MPGLGRTFRRLLINEVFDSYVALSVTDPLDDLSGFVEANTIGVGGYSRQFVTFDRSQPLPTPGQPVALVSTSTVTWTSTAPWNLTRAVAWALFFDAATGVDENIYTGWVALNPARLVNNAGVTITIPAGALKLTLGLQQY